MKLIAKNSMAVEDNKIKVAKKKKTAEQHDFDFTSKKGIFLPFLFFFTSVC
jgi:hypothetical protein